MPSAKPAAELTLRAIVIGLVLSVVMGAANVYLGLKAGMTVSASIPAAVMGALLLRLLFRAGGVLEANQIQTAASAGESLAAGIIFTMPALVLIGVWDGFDFLTTAAVAFAGGTIGILFMIPMRRVFVVDNRELPYPEGVACAAVLEASGGAAGAEPGATAEAASSADGVPSTGAGAAPRSRTFDDAASILWGAGVGAVFKLAASFLGLFRGALEGAIATASGRIFYFGSDISPALLAVGFIVRLNVAVLIFIGGAIGWLVCIPLFPEIDALLGSFATPVGAKGAAVERAAAIWSQGIRYVGVGAMVVGGIASIVRVRAGLYHAIDELVTRFRGSASGARTEPGEDLPAPMIAAVALVAVAVVAVVYFQFTGSLAITALSTVLMVVTSFFFVAVASYIVGLVGNSNSPVSGMTITAVLFTGAMLWAFGFSGQEGMVATLGVAAIVCCSACTAGDVCNDLKTGSLVGATPRRQQMMQIAGVAVASLVMAPVLGLLNEAYTIGSPDLPAPQAGLFASLARGLFGDGALPWGLVGLGVAIGICVLGADAWLERRGSTFRAHLMPVAVGIYLPFGLSVPILAGGILAHLHTRMAKRRGADTSNGGELDRWLRRGVLFASGIIAGESLLGIGIAVLKWLEVSEPRFDVPLHGWVTGLGAAAVVAIFYWRSRPHLT